MRVIVSPAKKMVADDALPASELPVFIDRAERLLSWLRSLDRAELKRLWAASDAIVERNIERLRDMDLRRGLTPALLAYDGIQYTYMAPAVFDQIELDWVQEHLRILSGFYGVLRPMDGVVPYRLEMQAKAAVDGCRDLYAFWGESLIRELRDASGAILNLASKEYSKAVEAHLGPRDRWVSCVFGELEGGRVVQKGVYAKMARGEMVRYLASTCAQEPEDAKGFAWSGYSFDPERSGEDEYVFIRSGEDA